MANLSGIKYVVFGQIAAATLTRHGRDGTRHRRDRTRHGRDGTRHGRDGRDRVATMVATMSRAVPG